MYGSHLGRDKNQRTALFRGLIRSLILTESITTTQAKAKAIKGLFDRLVNKAKKSDNASQRVLQSFLVKEDLIKKLTGEISPRFSDRSSGFTQIVRLGTRSGDGAMMVKMSLVGRPVEQNISGSEKIEEKKKAKRVSRKKERK